MEVSGTSSTSQTSSGSYDSSLALLSAEESSQELDDRRRFMSSRLDDNLPENIRLSECPVESGVVETLEVD